MVVYTISILYVPGMVVYTISILYVPGMVVYTISILYVPGIVVYTISILYVPGVFDGLTAGKSLLGVELHQVANEVFCRVGDGVPVGGVELVVSSHDLLEELRVTLVVEWRVATQPGWGGGGW